MKGHLVSRGDPGHHDGEIPSAPSSFALFVIQCEGGPGLASRPATSSDVSEMRSGTGCCCLCSKIAGRG